MRNVKQRELRVKINEFNSVFFLRFNHGKQTNKTKPQSHNTTLPAVNNFLFYGM